MGTILGGSWVNDDSDLSFGLLTPTQETEEEIIEKTKKLMIEFLEDVYSEGG